MGERVLEIFLNRDRAQEFIRECAADDRRVILSNHAKERMVERRISKRMIITCLRQGEIQGTPTKSEKGWQCEVVNMTAGIALTVQAGFIFDGPKHATIVITAYKQGG